MACRLHVAYCMISKISHDLYVKKHIKFIERHDLKFDKEHFESVFIEVNKAVFSTKHTLAY